MKLTKKRREALKQKYAGHCAYCGSMLGDRWHADHIAPIGRTDWFARHGFTPKGHDFPELDVIENLNPACPPCNIDKHSLSLEDWRLMIQRSNDVLARDVSTFRRAVRFGLLELRSEPVTFHFERVAARTQEGASHE